MVGITNLQIEETRKISSGRNIPVRDAFHAIIARDSEAILITRDYHFQKMKEIIMPHLPEEFI